MRGTKVRKSTNHHHDFKNEYEIFFMDKCPSVLLLEAHLTSSAFAANKSAVYNSTTDTWLFSVEEICLEQNADQETFVGE